MHPHLLCLVPLPAPLLPKFPADRPSSSKKCHAKSLSSHCVILKKSEQGWDYYPRCDFAHFPSSGADRAHLYSSSLWRIMENKSSSQNEPCWSEGHAGHVLEVSLEHTQAPSSPASLLQHESPLGSVLLRAEPWIGDSMHVPGDPKTDAWGSSCLHSPQPCAQVSDVRYLPCWEEREMQRPFRGREGPLLSRRCD